MTFQLEYYKAVQRWIPASVALFALLLLPVLLGSSQAQINGVPASVTSPGFGGRPVNGTSPSVTSLGPNGFAPRNPRVTFSTRIPFRDDRRHHHRDRDRDFLPFGAYYTVPVYYASDNNAEDYEDESDYQGGPTIFDRRGSGAASYIPPEPDSEPAHVHSVPAPAPPAPETPQAPTLLVFKDGHQLEVGNYAIVGQTLFDLTPGHSRKLALADLDLPATQKQNDDRGVSFQLPPSAQAN